MERLKESAPLRRPSLILCGSLALGLVLSACGEDSSPEVMKQTSAEHDISHTDESSQQNGELNSYGYGSLSRPPVNCGESAPVVASYAQMVESRRFGNRQSCQE